MVVYTKRGAGSLGPENERMMYIFLEEDKSKVLTLRALPRLVI